jgi:hypothetical protein
MANIDINILDEILGDVELGNTFYELNTDDNLLIPFHIFYNDILLNQLDIEMNENTIEQRMQNNLEILRLKTLKVIDDLEANDYSDKVDEVKSIFYEILRSIIDRLCKKFGFSLKDFDNTDNLNNENLIKVTIGLYSFLILDRVDNAVEYVVQTIINNKSKIYNNYKKEFELRKNSPSLASHKNAFKDIKDVIIFSFLKNIISGILNLDSVSVKELMDNVEISNKDVSTEVMRLVLDEEDSEFVRKFLEPFNKNENSFQIFVNLVRMRILTLLEKNEEE